MVRRLLNFVVFQAGWFACVLAGAVPDDVIPVVAALVAVGVHLAVTRSTREGAMIVAVAAGGLVVDVTLTSLGALEFHPDAARLGVIPVWIVSLWLVFATTFNASLKWMAGRPLLAFVLGAIGSPLSYRAGMSFDAVTIPGDELWPNWIAIGVGWGIAMPLLMAIAQRIVDQPDDRRVEIGVDSL